MKNLNFSIISTYIYFTICNAFLQVSAVDFQNNKLNLFENSIVINGSDEENDDAFFEPIKFTPTGLKCFFNHKFNHARYSEDFLPHNLADIIQFLEFSKSTNQNRRFVRTTLKIFNQKFKSLSYLSAKEFTQLINKMPDLLDYSFYFVHNDEQTTVKNILFNEFKYRYSFFQDDPRKFVNHLSEQICNAVHLNTISLDDISAEEFRMSILRFLETGISKIVWFIEDEPDIWVQFKDTCKAIYKLKERNILHEIEDINDLMHGALIRFLYILDIRGSEIPVEFYEKVWTEIHDNPPAWLAIEELDELVENKKNKLLKGIKKGHCKSVARSRYGLISNS